jgi:hypothetical protein
MSKWVSKLDIRLGAIYRFGLMRRMDRDNLATLLVTRAGMSPRSAVVVVDHWLKSLPYRAQRVPR